MEKTNKQAVKVLSDGEKEELPFNNKKLPAEPGSRRGSHLLWLSRVMTDYHFWLLFL